MSHETSWRFFLLEYAAEFSVHNGAYPIRERPRLRAARGWCSPPEYPDVRQVKMNLSDAFEKHISARSDLQALSISWGAW